MKKAIILAAGDGTRMMQEVGEKYKDVLKDLPKTLLELDKDFTILDFQIGILQRLGYDITIIVGYFGEKIVEFCKKRGYNVSFIWNNNFGITSDLYTFRLAMRELNFESWDELMVWDADTVFDKITLKWLLSSNADVAVVTRSEHGLARFKKDALPKLVSILESFTLTKADTGCMTYCFGTFIRTKTNIEFIENTVPRFYCEDIDRFIEWITISEHFRKNKKDFLD